MSEELLNKVSEENNCMGLLCAIQKIYYRIFYSHKQLFKSILKYTMKKVKKINKYWFYYYYFFLNIDTWPSAALCYWYYIITILSYMPNFFRLYKACCWLPVSLTQDVTNCVSSNECVGVSTTCWSVFKKEMETCFFPSLRLVLNVWERVFRREWGSRK